jgi:hypothetical protein
MYRFRFFFLLTLFLIALSVHAQNPLPDFAIDSKSITFSNPSPREGEEITIYVTVQNIGQAAVTLNEDLVVNLYEGDPATKPLQILCRDVILGLQPGKSGRVKTQWRPPAGTTEVYAVVNPKGGAKEIKEANHSNNMAHTSITAAPRTFPKATPEQIQATIQKGVAWIKSQQGKHNRTCLQCGTENQLVSTCVICGATLKGLPEDLLPGSAWDFGEDNKQETAIALLALLSAGVPVSNAAVQKGLDFLMSQDWNILQVYQFAIIVPALVATNDPQYRERAQFAVNQLVKHQLPFGGDEFSDPRDDGGWGYGATADGAHMNMVVYALYAAKQGGLDIPKATWERAEKWIRRNQTETGGWLYNLVDSGSPWAEGVYGSMTATGLWALRACGVPVEDPQIQSGLEWIKKYWSITRNPAATSWVYYYLLALQRFCDIPPQLDTLVGHHWYEEISSMLIAEQQPDGRWIDYEDYFPTTCFALMFLARALPRPTRPNLGAVNRTLRSSPPEPRVGEPVRISVTLANTGAPLDATVMIDFYDGNPNQGGKKIDSQDVLFTSNRAETTTTINWTPKQEGVRQLYVRIDPERRIDDLDRNDNVISQPLTIRPKSAAAVDSTGTIHEISKGVYQIGDVVVDVNKREVILKGEINIINSDIIIEFFACGKLGKTHESLLTLDAEPIHIQLALLRLNMNPGMNLTVEGDPHAPQGDLAEIWVEWERGGKTVRYRAEELVQDAMKAQPMEKTHWVFTGARIIRNQFTAQLFHNIIAVYRDPDSIFNHPLPGGTDDRTYRVNTDVLPPKGTPVKVVIHPIQNQAQG